MFNLKRRKDPLDEARAVVDAYLAHLGEGAPLSNERALPHAKATIRAALLILIDDDSEAERRLPLVRALLALASFQRMSVEEERLLTRRRELMMQAARSEAAQPYLFELQILEAEASRALARIELAYELDVERYERDLANLGFAAEANEPGPDQALPRRSTDAT